MNYYLFLNDYHEKYCRTVITIKVLTHSYSTIYYVIHSVEECVALSCTFCKFHDNFQFNLIQRCLRHKNDKTGFNK